jgi:2-oxoglutarate ferredoxin oxidoreductase subunit beta
VAIGAKCANPDLIVLTIGGDGDGYAEGGNHLLHAMRRNHDVTYLVHDNQVYGLTKGQASPTSDEGFVTKSTPRGAGMPINPIGFAILGGASFVARGFAGDVAHLSSIIKKGIRHKGFSLIDILQPCVSFNHRNTFEWYRERIYKMEDEHGYDVANRKGALEKAEEWEQRIPIGILYRVERDSFEEKQPALSGIPPVKQEIIPVKVKELLANHR